MIDVLMSMFKHVIVRVHDDSTRMKNQKNCQNCDEDSVRHLSFASDIDCGKWIQAFGDGHPYKASTLPAVKIDLRFVSLQLSPARLIPFALSPMEG